MRFPLLALLFPVMVSGCSVVAVADAAVTVVATTVKVGATVVGATVDVDIEAFKRAMTALVASDTDLDAAVAASHDAPKRKRKERVGELRCIPLMLFDKTARMVLMVHKSSVEGSVGTQKPVGGQKTR